jgi:aryl-alcohol dehydrogenase-like predicted oxidoreductase
MQYRKLGKTGMEASIIGFGAEHVDGKPYEIVKRYNRCRYGIRHKYYGCIYAGQ